MSVMTKSFTTERVIPVAPTTMGVRKARFSGRGQSRVDPRKFVRNRVLIQCAGAVSHLDASVSDETWGLDSDAYEGVAHGGALGEL